MKYVIGIDIGGTNLRIGTVDAEGRLMNFEESPVLPWYLKML